MLSAVANTCDVIVKSSYSHIKYLKFVVVIEN